MRAVSHRFVLLDGFRGLAALLVVLFHAERDGSPFYRLDPLFLMVDFFFVLSGFVLLPSMPTRFSPRTAGRFIGKRVLRLLPMVGAAVALSMALYYANMWWVHRTGAGFNYDLNRTPSRYAAALVLLQIWVPKSIFIVVPLWSLSAEWFANLVFTPLTAVRRNVGIMLGVVAGVVMYRHGLAADAQWVSWIGPIRGWEALGRALAGFGVGLLVRKAHDDFDRVGRPAMQAGSLATAGYFIASQVAHWVYVHTPYEVDSHLAVGVGAACAAIGASAAVRAQRPAARSGGVAETRRALIGRYAGFAAAVMASYLLLDEYRNAGYGVVYAAPVVFGFLVLAASRITVSGERQLGRLCLRLGAWSFGVYAFHRTVMDAFNTLTAEPLHWYSAPTYMAPNSVWLHYVALKTTVVTIVCVLLAIAVRRLVEEPLRQLMGSSAR